MMNDECLAPQPDSLHVYCGTPIILHSPFLHSSHKGRTLTPCRISTSWWLPPGTSPDAALILAARGIRAFTDGYVALLLPYYLTLLGYSAFEVGLIATATLLGSGLLTLLTGLFAYRFRMHAMLTTACLLMLGTGLGFAVVTDFWPLLLIAVIGTLNPSSGDVSVFSPLEQLIAVPRSNERAAHHAVRAL